MHVLKEGKASLTIEPNNLPGTFMLPILVNFDLIDSEVLEPPGKNVPNGTQLQPASDSLGLFMSPNQPIENFFSLTIVGTRSSVKMEIY